MVTKNVSTLKIHKLTQAQYDRELEAGRINENELYLTPYEVNPTIESSEYSGCYYRVVYGEREWINPPMIDGVRYRTTERYNGSPIYVCRVRIAAEDSSSTIKTYDALSGLLQVISITGTKVCDGAYIHDLNSSERPCTVSYKSGALYINFSDDKPITSMVITIKFTM